jgi:hypothetical protein
MEAVVLQHCQIRLFASWSQLAVILRDLPQPDRMPLFEETIHFIFQTVAG